LTSSTGSGRPSLIVVTGPSGAGKGTLIGEVLKRVPELEVTVSATTRDRRPGEEDGRDYWFLTADEFLARIEADEFLEHVVYVSGHRYGTLRPELERIRDKGEIPLLELETEGALRVKAKDPGAVTIFSRPPWTSSSGVSGSAQPRARARSASGSRSRGSSSGRPTPSTTSSRTTIWSGPSRS